MPSNQERKGKGTKGANYDELSGVGTSSAGRGGGVGSPELSDSGNLQSGQGGNSQRGYSGSQQSGNLGKEQSGQADRLRGNAGDRKLGAKQESQDDIGTAGPSER